MNKIVPLAIILFFLQPATLRPNWTTFKHEVSLSPEDRALIERAEAKLANATKAFDNATDAVKELAEEIRHEKFSKIITQSGIALTATATAILSAYAVFLIVQYELARQPEDHADRKNINWKTILAGTLGTAVFAASFFALLKSGTLANYALAD